MILLFALALAAFQPFVWAADRLRELPDEQLKIQSTLGILYDGLLAEDEDVIVGLIYVRDDPGKEVARAQARRVVANMRFGRAASLSFDISHDNPFAEFDIFHPDDFAFAYLTGDWKIEGNRATLPPDQRMGGAEQPPSPPLINVRGVWKVNLTPKDDPADLRKLAARIDDYSQVVNDAAAKITAGKLRTAEEIKASLQRAPKLDDYGYAPPLILGLPRDEQPSSKPAER